MFSGLGKLPSHFNADLKISPQSPRGFLFHLQPKFPRGYPPPTTKIPGDSPRNLRDFARWESNIVIICMHSIIIIYYTYI